MRVGVVFAAMLILSGISLLVGLLLWLPILSDLFSAGKAAARGLGENPIEPVGGGHFGPLSEHGTNTRRFFFLIPAHNEEALIGDAVRSIRNLDYPADRVQVVVVADNCVDGTAKAARRQGAICLERDELEHPGKPAAVAWALQRSKLTGFDAVIIVDADSVVSRDFAEQLAAVPKLPAIGVQTYNGVRNPDASPLTRMASVLSTAYYRFAYPLKQRAGLNVPLTGAGMCLGTGLLQRQGWVARSLAEDVETYVLLTLGRDRTVGCPSARVLSIEAATPREGVVQRRRWRRGRLQVARAYATAILRSGTISAHQKLDLFAELLTPGPATHLAVSAVLSVLAVGLSAPGASWIVVLALSSLLRPATYTSLAVATSPDRFATVRAFLFLPVYAAWRLGLELLSALGDGTWRRSDR